ARCRDTISRYLNLDGTFSISAEVINNGSSDNCSPLTLAIDKSSFTWADAGTNTITLTVTDVSGNQSTCTTTLNILKRPTVVTYNGDASEQYSDRQQLSATLVDSLTQTPLSGKPVSFTIGVQSATATTTTAGIGSSNLVLYQDPANIYSVVSAFAGDAIFKASTDTDDFDITQEDARAYYTGALFVSTSSISSGKAIVTLAATIKDITRVGGDALPGDIRNATVNFVVRNGTSYTVINPNPLVVGLVNADDTLVGAVTYNWPVDILSANSKDYTVGIIVNGFYLRDASEEDEVITISKPLSDFITGGGYLLIQTPAGLKAPDEGSKNNFGFNVKYNKKGTNLQGSINTIIRRTEDDDVLHTYQIKGNAMTSLSVRPGRTAPSTNSPATALFNGKASIQDITNPYAPVAVDGNATLQVSMTDKGEPGINDLIGITVWAKNGGVWYSSNWNGTNSAEQLLAAGNLKVSTSSSFSTGGISNKVIVEQPTEDHLRVKVVPNPTNTFFTLTTESKSVEPLNIIVSDLLGRLVEVKSGILANGTIMIGHNYRPGSYYARIVQGEDQVVVKMMKQPD
ncbi:MAG: T9SS type A sorting domain-containing protein, partial [Candidatus Dadabacteria bacterium]